ncbi:Mrp/NBP35 family ATP-binding protein [Streptomyces thioluteus]|uniref:Iron-sulfur cluster carrier protein n=1 Tax=Streptomyces thioluteus TaxID=66431 RepID=A0ABN3WU12_STRTU
MATETPNSVPAEEAVRAALATVNDPEIHRPITELGMVKSVDVAADGTVAVAVYLTVSGCPMRETITENVRKAVAGVAGVTGVTVELDVMSDEQRRELATALRGGTAEREVPFAKPGSLTRVYAVASGKGGVGKSSVTVNLAAAMAADGLKVGVVDADIYGHSVPRMLGAEGRPTQVENMIMPPSANGVKVISIGMFTPGNTPVVWRGPMLHRALQQFLADVYWGDLDVLLLDLPPGTGDIAISVAQLVPNAEILVVTTPQQAAAEVAERAGSIAVQTHQKIVGVVENMSGLPCPHCGEMVDVFGTGGGQIVADGLTRTTGATVPVLGSIPIDVRLREGGDEGRPVVLTDPRVPRGQRAARHRRQAGRAAARAVGDVARHHAAQQVLTAAGPVPGSPGPDRSPRPVDPAPVSPSTRRQPEYAAMSPIAEKPIP